MSAFTTRLLPRAAPARVLACGAWLKNTACLVDGRQVHWSPLHDDLADPEHCARLDASIETLLTLADGPIEAVAHDLHPDFHSTHAALRLAARLGVPAIAVQHHHAHIAVVQAEQGLVDSEAGPLIGLALDGVGLGPDGTAWGGEVLRVDGAQWQRLDHLPALKLPGGDVAAREPWRMAAAALHLLGRDAEIVPRLAPRVGQQAARTVQTMLARDLNCPPSTGAGRWFDAVAGLLHVTLRQNVEAEAAMELERLATAWLAARPSFDAPYESLDLRPLLAELLPPLDADGNDSDDDIDVGQQAHGAALFHVALANALVATAERMARHHGATTVALGGGCFFNRVLQSRVTTHLQARGLRVLQPTTVNCGDAGLALGQAWAAACRVVDPGFEPELHLLRAPEGAPRQEQPDRHDLQES